MRPTNCKMVNEDLECLGCGVKVAAPTMQAHLAALADAMKLQEQFLIGLSLTLDRWAKQSVDGAWSTHQVEPNRREADACRKIAADARTVISAARKAGVIK